MLEELDWLTELVNKLPRADTAPETLFDTLGVSTRETVISNVLAYYLDENEAHGLGRRFLNSLITCMNKEVEQFPSPYTVEREVEFIDIVLRGDSNKWAILVENKIYHILNNDLDVYWNRVQASDKVGVVTALKPIVTGNKNFVSVSHKDWLQQVRTGVDPIVQWPDDIRQRLLFTDFLTTMDNNTASLINNPATNEAIKRFQEHRNEIDTLLKTRGLLLGYIQAHIKAAFEGYGFVESEKRFYYPDKKTSESEHLPQLRFYVLDNILTDNKLSIYFELYGDATQMGPTVLDSIIKYHPLSSIQYHDINNKRDKVEGVYYHIAYTTENVVMSTDDLQDKLDEIIGRFFAEVQPGISLYNYCSQLCRK